MQRLSNKETFMIGSMLFALFFGAGNMIFPPALGQAAGTNMSIAILGFLVTGVGLPLLAVAAIARFEGNLQILASRVHPWFAVVFTLMVFLAIGPFLGIPRTATVAFEMGALPFLPVGTNPQGGLLFVYTLLYFGLTFWLSLNPSKLVERIGKVITPVLLVVIGILVVRTIFSPLNTFGPPADAYVSSPFFTGFIEGYFTLDALGALVFGIVVITAIRERGLTDTRGVTSATIKAGFIAATGLSLVYVALGYLGAASRELLGPMSNGGEILSGVVGHLLGWVGIGLLGLAITLACLTTSVGLVTACGEYFVKLMPRSFSYQALVGGLCLFSMGLANLGLNQILAYSVPLLIGLYPLAMVLIVLSFFDRWLVKTYVYSGAMIGTGLVSIVDSLQRMVLDISQVVSWYEWLPLYEQGLGWLVPALIGGLLGYFVPVNRTREEKKVA
ncbi:branched-chain amino acid transport system II carrier protein [Ammoniphilus sp. CFH 90114]|uniref:branched-chain amino acid transport system II carrier protein n=1 Tax=Ammoniphilus sp. CFH 90114 TaxID=2493665 RepID=UPI00100E0674|nr:branched-chain amino acid transport system II carrier protein [Ammoniphilus sp. CFH 90114]RXT02878.1 branched-chain amino acid transport system II carrier protein [Ammoniphilus sp. CFH 90114]